MAGNRWEGWFEMFYNLYFCQGFSLITLFPSILSFQSLHCLLLNKCLSHPFLSISVQISAPIYALHHSAYLQYFCTCLKRRVPILIPNMSPDSHPKDKSQFPSQFRIPTASSQAEAEQLHCTEARGRWGKPSRAAAASTLSSLQSWASSLYLVQHRQYRLHHLE